MTMHSNKELQKGDIGGNGIDNDEVILGDRTV
jgi:hypothetical protein